MNQSRSGRRSTLRSDETGKHSPRRAKAREPVGGTPHFSSTTATPRVIAAGRAIVEILKAEGVKTVYGIPGGHVLPIYDGLYDIKQIRHFLVRHEQAAASMAGYAQLTGEAAVCLVTAGPGATNLVTNVAEAFVGALPMVILAGRSDCDNVPWREPRSGY